MRTGTRPTGQHLIVSGLLAIWRVAVIVTVDAVVVGFFLFGAANAARSVDELCSDIGRGPTDRQGVTSDGSWTGLTCRYETPHGQVTRSYDREVWEREEADRRDPPPARADPKRSSTFPSGPGIPFPGIVRKVEDRRGPRERTWG
jgi:hypothetical protein